MGSLFSTVGADAEHKQCTDNLIRELAAGLAGEAVLGLMSRIRATKLPLPIHVYSALGEKRWSVAFAQSVLDTAAIPDPSCSEGQKRAAYLVRGLLNRTIHATILDEQVTILHTRFPSLVASVGISTMFPIVAVSNDPELLKIFLRLRLYRQDDVSSVVRAEVTSVLRKKHTADTSCLALLLQDAALKAACDQTTIEQLIGLTARTTSKNQSAVSALLQP